MILAWPRTLGEEIKDLVSFHNLGPSALPSRGWEQDQALTDQANLSFREVASSPSGQNLAQEKDGQMQAGQKLSPATQGL